MKTFSKTLLGATAATTLALASASPAHARDNDGIDAGDVAAGVLILGGIAAIAAATSNNDNRYERRNARYDRDYRPRRNGHQYGVRQRPRQAIRQCRRAARNYASQYGRAQITEITDVDRKRNGYEVEGRLVVEQSHYGRRGRYRNANYDRGRFTCRIRHGQIARLRVRGLN